MLFHNIIELCCRLLSARIETVDINRVWFDHDRVYKCRRWYGWVLILIGNPVLACRQVPVRVLFSGQWVRWERKVKQVLNGETIAPGRMLVCNQLPGVSLANWLAGTDQTKNSRLDVLRIAVRCLHDLHRLRIDGGRGQYVLLSHGDATLNNVLYDEATRSARWFDFDLCHWMSVRAPLRHADDLRAFLFSAALHFPEDELCEVVLVLRTNYDSPEVWQCLEAQLVSRWMSFDLFHRAQIRRAKGTKHLSHDCDAKLAELTKIVVDTKT